MRSTPDVDVFEIGYDSFDGVRIAGWYCVPTERHLPPPYPALLIAPGYLSEPTLPKSWAKQGYAALGIAPRGKLRSNRRFNPGYPGLMVHNILDHQAYGYRGLYVDACRAVDFVLSRPEVDHDRIGIVGHSQGGSLALTTAALRNDVIICAAAGAPFLAGVMDALELTRSYPYEEINAYLRQFPDREPAVRQTIAYYDAINFAPAIRCPVLISIGLGDDVSPPETGFALDAALTCHAELHAYPRCAHDAGSYWEGEHIEAFLAGHLRPGGYQPPSEDTDWSEEGR